jgi:hypothetical protein
VPAAFERESSLQSFSTRPSKNPPQRFYVQADQDLDACLRNLALLKEVFDSKLGEQGPVFGLCTCHLVFRALRMCTSPMPFA